MCSALVVLSCCVPLSLAQVPLAQVPLAQVTEAKSNKRADAAHKLPRSKDTTAPLGQNNGQNSKDSQNKDSQKESQVRDSQIRDSQSSKDVRAYFTAAERQRVILGLGNPVAQLLVFRVVEQRFPLVPRQVADLQQLAKDAGPQLVELRSKRAVQDRQLEAALYGEQFDETNVQRLTELAARTERELIRLQLQTEVRLFQTLARGNPRRARVMRLLYEQVVQSVRNPAPSPLVQLARSNNGQWRLLAESLGDDWDMMIPGFGNPLAVLLIFSQLELTPAQKVALKTLAGEVRGEFAEERAERDKQLAQRPNAGGNQPAAPADPGDELEWGTESNEPNARPAARNFFEQVSEERAKLRMRQIRRQARIESTIRQTLQPTQWEQYLAFLRGIALNRADVPLVNQPSSKMDKPILRKKMI